MKILFIGSVYFSKVMLEKLLSLNANIVGIVTKEESAFNADFVNLGAYAAKYHIPCNFVENINDAGSVEWIRQMNPDIIFCFGWSNLIKKEILEICPMGVLGFHPTLLPLNKGRHPIIWAKILGLKKSGTTFFFMDEGADSGDILDQMEFEIEFEDDAESLYHKMIDNALHQVESFLPKLIRGDYPRIKQEKVGTVWRKRNQTDGLIDFRMTSEAICNLVRGLTKPYAGAHCLVRGEEIKIWKVQLAENQADNLEPGKVLDVTDNIVTIKTSNGAILIEKHEFITLPKPGTYIR